MKQCQKSNFLYDLLNSDLVRTFLWLIVLLLVWEAIVRTGLTPSYILPPFSKVFSVLLNELMHGNLLVQTGRSLVNLIEAVGFSLSISLVAVFFCLKSKLFNSLFGTIALIFNSIPSMAIMPLIIMWFGIDSLAILIVVAHSVLWTFTIHLNGGIKGIPKIHKDFANNIQLGIFAKMGIYLPVIMPDVVAGLKIAWSRAWRSLIGAEIIFGAIGSVGGLGYFININRINGNMAAVMSGIVIMAIIGIIIEYLVFNRLDMAMRKRHIIHD